MFVRIWHFRVRPEKLGEFRAAYGRNGNWAELFGRAAGYLHTELLESATDPNTYLTIDRWESAEAWDAFLREWAADYTALDRQFEALTLSEVEVGTFSQ